MTISVENFSNLVPVTQTNGKGWVDARKLHQALEVGRDFSNWIKGRIEKYGFREGFDYEKSSMITDSPDSGSLESLTFSEGGGFSPNLAKTSETNLGGRPSIEYSLTTDMAKQLCMVENNERGLLARQYFIACEEKLREKTRPEPSDPLTVAEILVRMTRETLQTAGLEPNQVAIGMSNTCRKVSGYDILALSGIDLPSPIRKQALTPTQLGKELGEGINAREVNRLLTAHSFQEKRANGGYDPTILGEPYALMLDTAKRHSDGTPVKQLKWYTTILPIMRGWITTPVTDTNEGE